MLRCIALLGLMASSAHAEVEVVTLEYRAPAGCPDRDAFVAQITERTQAVKLAPRGSRTFAIEIAATGDGFTGRLVVDAVTDKQLSATQCADLASALALVTALAIDPTALAIDPAPPAEVTISRRIEVPGRSFEQTLAAASRRAWHPELAVSAAADSGVTPDLLLSGALHARIVFGTHALGRMAIAMSVVGGRDSTDAVDGSAAFTWLAVRPAACVVRTWTVEVSGCVHVELGLVRATGDEIINSRALTRLWSAAGALGEVRWPARSRGFAQLQLGAAVPFTRDRYRFNPGMVIHQTAPVTGWLGIGVGVRFP